MAARINNKVLVTGGAGYIGSQTILELLASGYEPVVLDNLSSGFREAIPDGVGFHEGAIDDEALVKRVISEQSIRTVIHFAAYISVPESIAEPVRYYRNNSFASLALIDHCLASGVEQFVFSSTAAVYGEPAVAMIGEDCPTNPINPYGTSKLMTEMMLRDVSRAQPSFRPVRLRYFNVAGADPQGRSGQRAASVSHLIGAAIEVALGRREHLEIFGSDYPTRDGTCERDYIHVADLASAHIAALKYLEEGGSPSVFNCGYGRGWTVREVIGALERLIGRKIPVRDAPRRPGDAASVVSDPTRLRKSLSWTPRYEDLEAMLGTALRWREARG